MAPVEVPGNQALRGSTSAWKAAPPAVLRAACGRRRGRHRRRLPRASPPGPGGPGRRQHQGAEEAKNVAPVYPDIAKQARVQGIVILECTISPQGTVTDVKVLRGIPLLDQAGIDAVKQWQYTPTLLNGVPVPVIMTVTVNFRLN